MAVFIAKYSFSHQQMSLGDILILKIEITFFKARNSFHLKNTRKCFPIRRLTLCTLSVNQKMTPFCPFNLFVLLR